MTAPAWDFDYRLVSPGYEHFESGSDLVVALDAPSSDRALLSALGAYQTLTISTLLAESPIYWYRLQSAGALRVDAVAEALEHRGIACRYVTSSLRGSLVRGKPLRFAASPWALPDGWPVRAAASHHEPQSPNRWVFHERGGVDIDRLVCSTGAGTRLAVIDDEALDSDVLPLDKEVFIGTDAPSRSALHGSLMVGWAVGVRGSDEKRIPPFTGIAPDASPRLYLIPKPGRDIFSLPWAIVRAVRDGADVVVCATYVDGASSPLLDDALSFAMRLGRRGRGTAVVFPTGREVSSPAGSTHASLTLSLGDPASDPRVLCVAPSGRNGGWFFWQDKRGKLRPFANRGPSVRVTAPGDDMSYPFTSRDRLGHAESSGASAVTAGVALLVLAKNPELRVDELYDVLAATATRADVTVEGELADPADLLPRLRDPDGHDAKTGYGRVSAVRACMMVADPVAAALVSIGEEGAARAYLSVLHADPTHVHYSPALAAWAARVFRRDPILAHALRAVIRHLRLASHAPERRRAQPALALARQLSVFADRLLSHDVPAGIDQEVANLGRVAVAACRGEDAARLLENWCFSVATRLFLA